MEEEGKTISELDAEVKREIKKELRTEGAIADRLLCSTDAREWAEEFVRCKQEQGWTIDDIDVDLMVGWFANAMVAQQYADAREYGKALKRIHELEGELRREKNKVERMQRI